MQTRDWLFLAVMGVGLWLSFGGKLPDSITPTPAPFPSDGLRVLILDEFEDRSKLPIKQLSAMDSEKCRNYLDAKTVKGADGSPEWQVWDDDTPTDKMLPLWKEAFEKAKADSKGHRPWVLISTESSGYNGPFPADEDAFLKLLQQHGGA